MNRRMSRPSRPPSLRIGFPVCGVAVVLLAGLCSVLVARAPQVEPGRQALVNHKRLVLGPSEVAALPALVMEKAGLAPVLFALNDVAGGPLRG
jgi:hypothetical protein